MRLHSLTILAGLSLAAAVPALAQDLVPTQVYGSTYRAYGSGYQTARYGGFAQPFIQGDYIGAPLSVVPRPSQLVPAPWSYGTYGIPTVSGIAAPPVAAPTLTVIHAPSPKKGFHRTQATRGEVPADVQVMNVSVPRR